MMNKEEYDINLDHYIEITQREYNNLKQENKDLQQRIDKANQIIDECLMLMPHEFSWEEQIENIRKILGGKE